MELDVLDSINKVPTDSWNDICARTGLYSSHEWLSLVESDTVGECKYITIHEAGTLIAGLPVYFVDREENDYYNPALVFSNIYRSSGSVCTCLAGSRSGYRNEILVHSRLSESQQRNCVSVLTQAAFKLARGRAGQYVSFLYLTYDGILQIADPARNIRPVLAYSGDAWLFASGECFSEYLQALPGKRRITVKAEMAKFAAQGLTVRINDVSDHTDRVAELACKLKEKYGHDARQESVSAEIGRQAEVFGDKMKLFGCWDGSVLTGMAVAIEWGGWLYINLTGFDYERLRQSFEYFNVVMYEPIKYCYEAGLNGLHLGMASHQAKALRGARINPVGSIVIPADCNAQVEAVPMGARRGVKKYWQTQLQELARYVDNKDRWEMVINMCSPLAGRIGGG